MGHTAAGATSRRNPTACTRRDAGTFIETEQGEIRFPEISTPVLEAVCKYFYYKVGAGGCWLCRRAALEGAAGMPPRAEDVAALSAALLHGPCGAGAHPAGPTAQPLQLAASPPSPRPPHTLCVLAPVAAVRRNRVQKHPRVPRGARDGAGAADGGQLPGHVMARVAQRAQRAQSAHRGRLALLALGPRPSAPPPRDAGCGCVRVASSASPLLLLCCLRLPTCGLAET